MTAVVVEPMKLVASVATVLGVGAPYTSQQGRCELYMSICSTFQPILYEPEVFRG